MPRRPLCAAERAQSRDRRRVVSLPAQRDPRGRLLPGAPSLNPGGRPRGAIEDVRERLGPHTAEFCAALVALVRSPNEATRLSAIREFFDRTLGKPAIAVDSVVTKLDLGAIFLDVVKNAGRPAQIDVTPPADELADNSTDQADDAW
jgi:hypothetical protein